jgi:hypothetical protein
LAPVAWTTGMGTQANGGRMKSRAKLELVEDPPLDIAALNRADIRERDWSRCHIAGDRAKPLPFFERIKRTWWK